MNSQGNVVEEICSSLSNNGYSARLYGFNAIDKYLGLATLPFFKLQTNADIAVLARLMENLRFPGVEIADGAVDLPDGSCYFSCLEGNELGQYSFPLLSFTYDWQSHRFHDPLGIYPLLRELKANGKLPLEDNTTFPKTARYSMLMDTALLLARYEFQTNIRKLATSFAKALDDRPAEPAPEPEAQRSFLICLLLSHLSFAFSSPGKRPGISQTHDISLRALA